MCLLIGSSSRWEHEERKRKRKGKKKWEGRGGNVGKFVRSFLHERGKKNTPSRD